MHLQSFGGEIENAVKLAIDAGYRHIDTAWAYENEAEIGKAVRAKIAQGVVKREDMFIVNKVSTSTWIFTIYTNSQLANSVLFTSISCGTHFTNQTEWNTSAESL